MNDYMNDYISLIQKNTLLHSLSIEEMCSYLRDGSFRICSHNKNNIVHFSGDVCLKLDIILSGKVIVERIDESGNLMTIAEFFSNEILGGNLLFSKNSHYPMTITAKQPTIILEIEKERLFTLLSYNHDFLKSYLEYVSDHAMILGDKINHDVNKTIRESIMSYLDDERKIQNSDHIKLNLTKKALAEKIGVQRTSLSRELAKMRNDYLILFDKNSITILKQ
ncbi:MAG: Crp/Fnr family transcriptional regulator [Dehalobacter sp. 4CP]|uniref:Crp/Fnr family transcriptional regulator n=1 Tax=Dehalobacter sp. CP TaxID=2594474 RepID=UPI0013CC2A80|nr:Crp/Fnr family transcriptional regulator [Dehalobacter sp. 4CP]